MNEEQLGLMVCAGVMLLAVFGSTREGCGGEAKRLEIAQLTASEEMPPKYGVMKAVDGVPVTHWAARNEPPIWIQARFANPQWLSRIRIRQCEQTSIYDNWRRISLSLSDGSCFSCALADQWQEQTISFPRRRASWFRITVESTYKTSHYVGISELAAEDEGASSSEVVVRVGDKGSIEPGTARMRPAADPVTGDPANHRAAEGEQLIAKLAPTAVAPGIHPTLFMNAEDVERAKENIRRHEWARRVFKGFLDGANQWTAMTDDQLRAIIPKKGAMFDNKAACPFCGAQCTASLDNVGKVSCIKCKKAYPDAEHPDDGQGWKDPKTGEITYFVGLYNDTAVHRVDAGIANLSHAYALTGDERCARALSVLLDALAVIYPTCDKGPVWYPGIGGRLNRPFYQTARTLIYYAREYDLTYYSSEWDKPSCDPAAGTRRANYEKSLLMNGADYCFGEVAKQKASALHNGNCDYLQGALAVGRVLGVQKFIDYVLESDVSIFNFIENTIDRDGQYFETSFGYSHWATDLFGHHAEMLWNYRSDKYPKGINLYDLPKLRMNYLRSESDIDCAGHQPALGDAGPDLLVLNEENLDLFSPRVYNRLEVLVARTTDPQEKQALQRRLYEYCGGDVEKRRGEAGIGGWLLFHAGDVPVPGEQAGGGQRKGSDASSVGSREPTSTLLAGARGVAILRQGTQATGQRCALLRYGATLNHGSPDEMNTNLYAFGREISYDQGYGWAHHRAGWAHSTVAHNVVVVNEKNQLLGKEGSGGSLEEFCESPSVRVVAADDPAAYGGEGVTRYRRLLALVDLSPDRSYLVDIFDVKGGQKQDWSQHFAGGLERIEGATLGPAELAESLAGPEYEWWKFVQPSGWIAGRKAPFYWNAPPENGYGFLYEMRKGEAGPGSARFIWKIGEREVLPSNIFSPANCVAGSSGCGARMLNLGSFFYRAEKPGDFIAFQASVERAGEYLILVKFYKSTHYGTVALKVDGKSVGDPFNAYSPTGYFADLFCFGRAHLERGPHELRLECVGKDAESAGYFFSLKYFAVEPVEFLDKAGAKEMEGAALTVLPPAQSSIVCAKAKGLGHAPESDYVLVRRAGQNLESRFVSLVEPFVGKAQTLSVEPMGVGGEKDGRCAVKVKAENGREDYFFDFPMSVGKGEMAFQDGGVRIRFVGHFGAVLTRSGMPFEVLLAGSQSIVFGDLEIAADCASYTGKVKVVDYERGLVTVEGVLPDGLSRCGSLVYFSRESYSRNAPYFISRVQTGAVESQLDLGGASLVLAHGRVSSDVSSIGVLENAVPLDRERAYGRKMRTCYFDGKAIRNVRTGDIGRVKNVNMDSSVVVEVNPGLRNGDRFGLLDVQPGDTFTIPAIIALCQSTPGEWTLRANAKVAVAFPACSGITVIGEDATPRPVAGELRPSGGKMWKFDPAASGTGVWRLKVTESR